MKRTPRSASRRAIRQFAREGAGLAGIRLHTARTCSPVRCERSVKSGTEVCIRNAISYCAIRVLISGSLNVSSVIVVELLARSSMKRRRSLPIEAFRIGDIQHRIAD